MSPSGIPIRYATDLLEAVVVRAIERRAREGNRAAADDYRRAADRIYARYDDAQSRHAAFGTLHAQMFEALGCGRPIVEAVQRLGLRVEGILVTRAWSAAEEGAVVGIDGTTVGVRLTVDRFGSWNFLQFLYHELGHLTDMLDPTFGYGLAEAPSAGPVRHGIEERFGILWDCLVDGRTARAADQPLATRSERSAEFVRLFPEFTPDAAETVVGLLWDGARPTYAELAVFARDPVALALWCGIPVADCAGAVQSTAHPPPRPGASCPLCGFPTFAWERTISKAIAERITSDFPGWSHTSGACERCVEGYALMAEVGGAR